MQHGCHFKFALCVCTIICGAGDVEGGGGGAKKAKGGAEEEALAPQEADSTTEELGILEDGPVSEAGFTTSDIIFGGGGGQAFFSSCSVVHKVAQEFESQI